MRRLASFGALSILLLAILVTVPTAPAALNGPTPFSGTFPYLNGFEGENLTVVSGAMTVRHTDAEGSFGFFNTTGVRFDDLRRVCWNVQSAFPTCPAPANGGFRIVIEDGGSFGLRYPGPASYQATAAHVLALFSDFQDDDDLNTYRLAKTLAGATVGGQVVFGAVPFIEEQDWDDPGSINEEDFAGIAGLDDQTVIHVLDGDTEVHTARGKELLGFTADAGRPAPFDAGAVFLPMDAGNPSVSFAPADRDAASIGLDLGRVQELIRGLNDAGAASGPGQDQDADVPDFPAVIREVLSGALLRLPREGIEDAQDVVDRFVLVRFDGMEAFPQGSGVGYEGDAALHIEKGKVAGAPALVGFWFFQMPWWSYLLWAVALGLFLTRLVLKAPKKNDRWDRFNWIGWVAGPLMFLLVFWLWDREVHAVWGTSLFSTDASGAGLLFVLVVQVVPLLYVLFAVATPLRIILTNSLRLGKQGSFMRLSTAVSLLLGFLLGALLLRSYTELVMEQVLQRVG